VSKTIADLRAALFQTLEGVRDGTLDLDRARAVNEVAKSIVESAKVEVDFLRVTGGSDSPFIGPESAQGAQPGINGVFRHRLGS
jgi:hypothetical protein